MGGRGLAWAGRFPPLLPPSVPSSSPLLHLASPSLPPCPLQKTTCRDSQFGEASGALHPCSGLPQTGSGVKRQLEANVLPLPLNFPKLDRLSPPPLLQAPGHLCQHPTPPDLSPSWMGGNPAPSPSGPRWSKPAASHGPAPRRRATARTRGLARSGCGRRPRGPGPAPGAAAVAAIAAPSCRWVEETPARENPGARRDGRGRRPWGEAQDPPPGARPRSGWRSPENPDHLIQGVS